LRPRSHPTAHSLRKKLGNISPFALAVSAEIREVAMRCTCPNCDRGLGLRWLPALSTTWKCRCGVTIQHNVNSFLESWLRAVFLWCFFISNAVLLALEFAGVETVVHGSLANVFLTAPGASVAIAAAMVLLSCPVGWSLAYLAGIQFSANEKIEAALFSVIVFGLTAVAIWLLIHFQPGHHLWTLR
jgi:hypothetical protein